jgi:hypothetical protein
MPASKIRSDGGLGRMKRSSRPICPAIVAFSLVVVTNRRYF